MTRRRRHAPMPAPRSDLEYDVLIVLMLAALWLQSAGYKFGWW